MRALKNYFTILRTYCEYLIALLICVEFVDVFARLRSFCELSFIHNAIAQYFVISFVFFSRINMSPIYGIDIFHKIETT